MMGCPSMILLVVAAALPAASSDTLRQWQRAEAVDGGALLTLPPELVAAWVVDANVRALCVSAVGAGATGAVSCVDIISDPGTQPLRVGAPLAAAAAEATATGGAVAARVGVSAVDASGRAARSPALLDVAVLPPPGAPWDARSPRALVVWPPVGHVCDPAARRLEVFFHLLGDVPGDAEIRVDFEGGTQLPAHVPTSMISIVLSSVEPATHVVSLSVVRRDAAHVDDEFEALGPKSPASFDAVLSDADVARHRHAPPAPRADAAAPAGGGDPVRVLFVGSMKWDGQKTIWLQQIRGLDRARFDLRYVSFMQDAEEQRHSKFATRLAALGVAPLLAPIPAIDAAEATEVPNDGAPRLIDVYNGSQATLDAYLVSRLDAAGRDVDACDPPWVGRTWRHLAATFADLDPDVVVFANARDSSDAILTAAARVAAPRAKIVMELPNLFPFEPLVADAIVAPSHYAATHASVAAAVARAPNRPAVAVVNPGVDAALWGGASAAPACRADCAAAQFPAAFARPGACAAPCEVVGFLARLAPEKSPGLLVHAAALVAAARPLARFVVVGDGAAAGEVKLLARLYGLENRFSFPGAVYGDGALRDQYAAFDVVVQPSLRAWSETFCIANVEAMAASKPVVSFGVGGVGEYLVPARTVAACAADPAACDDAPNGVFADSATPAALAGAILAVLEDPDARAALGANARAAVLDRFQVQDQLRKYAVLYTRLKAGADLGDLPWVLS